MEKSPTSNRLKPGKFYVLLKHQTVDTILSDLRTDEYQFNRDSTGYPFGCNPTGFGFDSIPEAIKATAYSDHYFVDESPFKVIDHKQNVVFDSTEERYQNLLMQSILEPGKIYPQYGDESLLRCVFYGTPYSSIEQALEDIAGADGLTFKLYNSEQECVFEGRIVEDKIVKLGQAL
jgi:hypothetical protein